MASKSFVRCKSFHCSKGSGKANFFEQDIFLMPTCQPSQKRKQRKPATFAEMDPRKLKAYEKHKAKQNELNDNRAVRYCRLLVETNFTVGDIRVHPTYNDENLPATFEEAQKVIANYVRKLKRMAKKKGKELKYVYVTELGSVHGRLHHHLLVNASSGLTREELEEAWPYGYCSTDINRDSKEAAGYLTKSKRNYKGKHIYSASRNLTKPTTTTSDTKVSKKKLRELTAASNEAIKAYFEAQYPEYVAEAVYRYVPDPEQEEQDIDEEQAKLWRDGFSYLRVSMRLKPKPKKK